MRTLAIVLALSGALTTLAVQGADDASAVRVIVCPEGAPANVKLAAKEVRRYVYLRTGTLLPLAVRAPAGSAIVLKMDLALEKQQYRLKTDRPVLTIAGGSEIAVLYGAYAFAEKLGVRFYLHGDVIPDERMPFAIPTLEETREPLFALRGVNPWGSHPFGFDAWSVDDYKAIITQLAKMRMNFIGMHRYPEGHPYAEPTVWHGLAGDFDATGKVKASYASRYFNTLLTPAWGDYLPKKTGDYSFGAAQLFERDDWAPSALEGCCPLPQTPEACNEVFNGAYKVTLKFCEPHFKAAGERICDVRVQGRTVLTNLDLFARVGQFAALDFVFNDAAVTNGALAVELVPRKSLPCISAIAVEGARFTSKINCGGPAYQDWQADAPQPPAETDSSGPPLRRNSTKLS